MADHRARVALGDALVPVGLLRFTQAGSRQFSSFAYDQAWLDHPRHFDLSPDMPLDGGPFHASAQQGEPRDALSGVFADAAPDSWGRRLLERNYGNGLSEFEYLTLSDDACRQGALRFLDMDGAVITGAAADAVPRLIDLEALTAIARAYEQGAELSPEDLAALAGAGGSGGGRPKANVRDGDQLWLAKFTSVLDQQPVERAEIGVLRLAAQCGITVPEARLELGDTPYPVALLRRFDRQGPGRIPYISARTALAKRGNALGSYTEIIDFMRGHSADPSRDFLELYRRLIFTILVSNKDDHLKNHGFLYVGRGQWRLSPMFDVNPAPDRNPHLETAILEGGSHDRSILLALEASEFFEIKPTAARALIRELATTVAQNWRGALRDAGVTGAQARGFEPAFEHDEAELARTL